jgi:ubiquinone/menaquinone biosynthesis C-methylase UbiE
MSQSTFQQLDGKLIRKKSIPYQQLAMIYNHVMRHVNYSHWARYITAVIQKQGTSGEKILDIGCGTGEFIFEIGKLGFPGDGCDPSPSMLQIAQQKNPSRKFWLDGLPDLVHTSLQQYPVITCLYDTMNYLESASDWLQALLRVYELLPPEGLFIFDVVSEEFCRLYFHQVDEKEIINPSCAYVRESYYHKAKAEQVNQFTIYTPEGIFEEKHIQKIFPFSQIEKIITQNTPFEMIDMYEDFTFFTAGKNSNRAHFILKKVDSR